MTTPQKSSNYQIVTALLHFLEGNYTELIVEGNNLEDSIFIRRGEIVAIGEAKHEVRDNWTLRALFYKGKKEPGPILQLMRRWDKQGSMGASILFSIANYSNKIDRGRLVPDQDELEEIIGSMRKRPGLEFERTVTEVIEFLSHLEFKHIPHEHAMTNLARWVRKNIANPTANGTEAAIALFEDETNFRGKRVSWSDILGALGGGPIERKKVETKARNFHMTRVEQIRDGQTPKSMRSTPKIIFHILPLRDFLDFEDKMKSSDIINKMKLVEPLAGLGSTDWSSEATGEGRLNFTHENDCRSYLHMFWKGGIEAVHGGLLTDIRGDKVPIPCLQLQHMLYRGLDRFLNLQNDIGVPPPFAMFLSLIEVAGYQVTEDSYGFKPKGGTHGKRIRKPEVNVRMQVMESYRSNRYTIVKKLVDNIWNEVGWDGAPDLSDQIVSRNPK